MKERIATGHRDFYGMMIHEGDTVLNPMGKAVVAWKSGQWRLRYEQGSEPLNRYGKGDIRRCDNSPVTTVTKKNIVTPGIVTTAPIVTPLSQPLSQTQEPQDKVVKGVL